MAKLLLLVAIVVLAVVVARAVRSRSGTVDPTALRRSKAEKLAAEQAVITRQGGQGMNQGGSGGGMGL